MIVQDLFETALVKPAVDGAEKLCVVSGYATAAMAFHHLERLKEKHKSIRIQLIVGMCAQDGLPLSNHKGFQKLVSEDYSGRFECSYIFNPPPVHSKVYVWLKNNKPVAGFSGSANYTQTAFGNRQREVLSACDPDSGFKYFNGLLPDTIYCTHPDAETTVRIYSDKQYYHRQKLIEAEHGEKFEAIPTLENLDGLMNVRVSLLDRHGDLPQRSGLNWGQRPEVHREPNQAYVKLPASVYKTDFFPARQTHFTVLTDDGKVLICARAQDNGKAVHTPHNNSLIGEYFRNRLGVPSGKSVEKADLDRYGRHDVVFYKIDDETYLMNFSNTSQTDG